MASVAPMLRGLVEMAIICRGMVPLLNPPYSYSWAVGFGAALVLYLLPAVPQWRLRTETLSIRYVRY